MSCFRAAVFLFALSWCAFAQTATSIIFGTVTDASGATVPNAAVTATGSATQVSEKVTANDAGNYIFPNLRPGTYTVSCEAGGFRKSEVTGVLVEVNQRGRVDFSLQVGEVREVIAVQANVTTVDTFSSTVKEVVDSGRIAELPLNGRQTLQLQALLPGAINVPTGSAASFIAINTSLSFAVNGTRANSSSYTLDGGLNMDAYNNLAAAFPNPDALQEFSIQTNAYSAVYGRDAGAVVTMVTKSGTNELHGSLFEFLRNDKLNTRNFFAAGVDPLRRNQFGGSVGGPVKIPGYNGKDRTFFFTSVEATRQVASSTISNVVVPSALERMGDFSQSKLPAGRAVADPKTVTAANPQGVPFPNNIIPASLLDPVAQAFNKAFFPLPNRPGNIAVYQVSLPTNDTQLTMRLDHSFSQANKASLRYFWDDFFVQQNAALPAFNSGNNWVTHNATLNDTYIFTPSVINSFNFTFARNTFIRSPLVTSPAKNWADLGCKSCFSISPPGVPTDWSISISNGLGLRVNTNYFSYMENFQYTDTLSVTKGNHLLSMGGDLEYVRRNGREFFQKDTQFAFNGTLSGSLYGYADYMLGAATTVFQNSPISSFQFKYTPILYFQDDWRVSHRLTVNLGLRWEPFLDAKEGHNNLGAFRPGVQSVLYPNAPAGALFAGDKGISDGIVPNRWFRFFPRVGFAYDPTGSGKTSIRGGYGVFSANQRLVTLNSNPLNQPFSLGLTTFGVQLSDPYATAPQTLQQLQNYLPVSTAAQRAARQFILPLNVNSLDPNFTGGYNQQWNLNVQREVFGHVVLTVAYVGAKGTRLYAGEEINPAIYRPGSSTTTNVNARRIYPGFGTITSGESIANSTYHSLQVSWNRRFGGGFSVLGSFTWSKALDLTSGDGGGGLGNQAVNPFNFNLDKGPADFDVERRFVTSFLWELPFFHAAKGWRRAVLDGWQLNGIVTLQSGLPFSVNAGTDRSLVGVGADRADVNGPAHTFNATSRSAKIQKFFDTSAFSLPALGTFGTSSRNSLFGPGIENFDAGLFKRFNVTEKKRFELRWEVFNSLNRPNFFNPVSSFTSPLFGRLTSARDPRIMQVALKFYF
ncbi:MAG: TonB-dependent receptor [Acidobacteriota bacterium]|nr:TonB-dependent receptor [Acidobacteriota bacterium]